jgi:hypothetical protein
MGGIDETSEFEWLWKGRVGRKSSMGAGFEGKAGLGAPADEQPIGGVAKAEGDTFEGLVVLDFGRSGGEAGKEGTNGAANVEATDDVGVDEFTEEASAVKTALVLESSMFGSVLVGADSIEIGDDGWGDGFKGLGTRLAFLKFGSIPSVLEQQALDEGGKTGRHNCRFGSCRVHCRQHRSQVS